jgi:DNA mismatch repair protein MutS2
MQENVVTIRNERYVIPVKQEYRSYVKGFVHDMSASGSTVFIEPLAVFELNNELNNLKIDENAEIERILYNLSCQLFPYTNELKLDVSIIGKLDFIFAKAKYSNSIKGITPEINTKKFVNLINARHPLIDENKVVPTTLSIGKNFSLLIITGPNTGGKTVTLKTVGLLELMACSGLNIPASEKSSIYVFDEIFADIGDDQSISDSLSTFSSHMINISKILNTATENSLILVDELGSGTDPLEGANLAISILEYFKNNNILTIATTHYQELKRYALVTPNVQNASVEFDIENLKPTYKLLLGIPGKSNAFAISEKLGIKKEIIDKARSLLDKQDVDIETLLKKIYDDKIIIEKEKEEIQKNLNQIELLKKSLQRDDSKLKMKEKELIDNAKIQARDILLDAKDEASKLINQMKQIETDYGAIDELNKLRNKLNSSIKEKSIKDTAKNTAANPISKDLIKQGLKVYITNLNQNGIVISSKINKNDEVSVQIGVIKTNINIKYLEAAKELKNDLTKPVISSTPKVSKTRTANSEINVIGLNVSEAIPIVDKFLDDCFLAKLQTARIVHGKGTGKLRQGIHSFLKKHKRVKSFRIGTYGEGEMGVTIVELT